VVVVDGEEGDCKKCGKDKKDPAAASERKTTSIEHLYSYLNDVVVPR